MSKLFIVILSCCFLLSACNGDDAGKGDPNCPADVVYQDPLLTISSVTDSSTGEELSQVKLENLLVDGQRTQFDHLDSEAFSSIDIVDNGDSAVCTLPCSLFTSEAEYSFVLSSVAYKPKDIEISPEYEDFDTSTCRSTYSGGAEAAFSLDPDF